MAKYRTPVLTICVFKFHVLQPFCLFLLGPDAVVPTSNVITWLADQPVKIRMGEGSLAVKPISIVTAFRRTVDEFPDHPALGKTLLTWPYYFQM